MADQQAVATKKVKTPIFRVSYPNVLKPRLNEKSGKMQYSVLMLIPKTADISAMRDLAKSAALGFAKWGGKVPAGIRNPFRDGDVEKPGIPEYKGMWFVSARSDRKPSVVDQHVNPIMDENELYPGCYAWAALTAYAYDNTGNRGVSFGLNGIQKVRDGEPLVGSNRAEDDFAPIAVESKAEDTSIDFLG